MVSAVLDFVDFLESEENPKKCRPHQAPSKQSLVLTLLVHFVIFFLDFLESEENQKNPRNQITWGVKPQDCLMEYMISILCLKIL